MTQNNIIRRDEQDTNIHGDSFCYEHCIGTLQVGGCLPPWVRWPWLGLPSGSFVDGEWEWHWDWDWEEDELLLGLQQESESGSLQDFSLVASFSGLWSEHCQDEQDCCDAEEDEGETHVE